MIQKASIIFEATYFVLCKTSPSGGVKVPSIYSPSYQVKRPGIFAQLIIGVGVQFLLYVFPVRFYRIQRNKKLCCRIGCTFAQSQEPEHLPFALDASAESCSPPATALPLW
jgi:hypothetical protein